MAWSDAARAAALASRRARGSKVTLVRVPKAGSMPLLVERNDYAAALRAARLPAGVFGNSVAARNASARKNAADLLDAMSKKRSFLGSMSDKELSDRYKRLTKGKSRPRSAMVGRRQG